MSKLSILSLSFISLFLLNACSSSDDVTSDTEDNTNKSVISLTSDSLKIDGREIYLRGEMNDYATNTAYRLEKVKDNVYCTIAPLRADWSPYRFKFADANWTVGSNFGFATPPGDIQEGASSILVNPNSRFEEIKFYPQNDGNYRFCLIKKGSQYYAEVKRTDKALATIEDLLFTPGYLFTSNK